MAHLSRDTSPGLRKLSSIGPAHTGLPFSKALLYGTLAVGILDILDAFIFFGLRGARPVRILQSIAAGLLGRDAFNGGWGAAALGLALHFFIAFVIVLVFLLASCRLPVLTRQPFIVGPIYGIAVYLVMTFVVVPASAAGGGGLPAWPVALNGMLIHMFGVGLPASLAANAAARAR
jgi:hypothetical protein